MVARARRMVNGFVLPLVPGSLLLSAAVALADPRADARPDWRNVGGVQHINQGCKQQFGNPGHAGTGCCTYAPGICWSVAAIGDPQVTGWANGATNFKIKNNNINGWKKWGNCATPEPGANAPCNEFPQFKCAYMDFYNGEVGDCTGMITTSVMVVVGPNCCGP